ncbi:uncharacterized protein SCHCODRAFT_02521587 [Schizophyllum commune H4-8]|uniref:C2H2-type domain-containing protein n=1 Tax=Schizophyllum commune (strain H4-8 / FGSC 9210) TaxID=578458 RepID=D8QLB8_SCHCM|nr:uncharacterized protein SCHCODRAFT_02521587 [Schizophyllum commune H4-8]KAI5884835.1 hypothetical protein SCHCODRAFT_02521587 [Schizophyllum commune H4-8]
MSTAGNDEIYESLRRLFDEGLLSGLLSDEQYKLEEIAEEPEDVTVIPDHFFHPRNYLPFWTDPPPDEDTTEASPSAVPAPQTAIPSASSATPTSQPNIETQLALQTPQPSPLHLPTAQAQSPAPQELAQPFTIQQEQHVNMGIGSTPSDPSTPPSTHLNAPISFPSTTVPAAIADTNAMPSASAGAPLAAANIYAPTNLYNTNSSAALPITDNTPAAAPDANEALLRALYAANPWYPTPPNSSRVPTPPGPQQMAAYPLFSPYAHIPAYAPVPYHAQIPTYGPHPAYMHLPAYAPMLPYALMPGYAPYPMQVHVPAPQGPMQLPNAPPAQTYYTADSAPMGGAGAPMNIVPFSSVVPSSGGVPFSSGTSSSNGAAAIPIDVAAIPSVAAAPTSGLPSRHYRPHVYEAARAEQAAQATHSAEVAQTVYASPVSQASQSAEVSQTAHAAQVSQPTQVSSAPVGQTALPSPNVLHAALPALKRKRDESDAEAEASGQRPPERCRWQHGREPCTYVFHPQDYSTVGDCAAHVEAHLEGRVLPGSLIACQWGVCLRSFRTVKLAAKHVAERHILHIPGRTSKKAKTSHTAL